MLKLLPVELREELFHYVNCKLLLNNPMNICFSHSIIDQIYNCLRSHLKPAKCQNINCNEKEKSNEKGKSNGKENINYSEVTHIYGYCQRPIFMSLFKINDRNYVFVKPDQLSHSSDLVILMNNISSKDKSLMGLRYCKWK